MFSSIQQVQNFGGVPLLGTLAGVPDDLEVYLILNLRLAGDTKLNIVDLKLT
jgi:hypothetical protein